MHDQNMKDMARITNTKFTEYKKINTNAKFTDTGPDEYNEYRIHITEKKFCPKHVFTCIRHA